VLVLVGAGAAVALAGLGQRVEQHDLLTHQISALTVNTGGGDVTVRTGGAPGTVEVTRKTRSAGGLTPLGATSWEGNTLTLLGDCEGCGDIDYEIRVPAGVDVTAKTGSGDIELDGGLGTVSLQTGSGDIDGDVAAADSITTRTGSGDMELRLGNAPSLLSAHSGSGDVDIKVPNNQSYAVAFRTGSGDTDINVPQQSTSDRKIEVQTGSGDISVSGG
jgi:hypothetical protein